MYLLQIGARFSCKLDQVERSDRRVINFSLPAFLCDELLLMNSLSLSGNTCSGI
jgi:hypothetical protein